MTLATLAVLAVAADPAPPARELVADKRLLQFPVKNGAPARKVRVLVGGREEHAVDIPLADGDPDWWAPLDISGYRGKTLTVTADRLPPGSNGLAAVTQADDLLGAADLYRERLRPGLHFSPRRGWTNDPNGLVFHNGEYHLFFQHNPFGWEWGNMHWGHAVSKDLVRWTEVGEALAPDRMGPMFSGSAVVDWNNTSGLGTAGKPPLVLIYTAFGPPAVQCLASSTDGGKTFAKFAGNPVLPLVTPGNRDPKVIWHEPTKRWVTVLYVGRPDDRPKSRHTAEFFTSPDLKTWTPTGCAVDGLYECPDLFELPVDGDPGARKWVLTAASSEYLVGAFDGRTFTPETPKLPGHRGKGFYAAQTFSDLPAADGRRIQVGWLRADSPGMPFNQCLSVPLDLGLAATADGPRLTWRPVREFDTLRGKATTAGPVTLAPGAPNPLAAAAGDLLDVVAEFEPGPGTTTLTVRGVPVRYDAGKQELSVAGHKAPVPVRDGKLDLRILTDRTAVEVFAAGGRCYVPVPVIPAADARSVTVSVAGGEVRFRALAAYELGSIWPAAAR